MKNTITYEELLEKQAGYTPRDDVLRRLSEITFVALMGPTSIGKSTVAGEIVRLGGKSFSEVNTSTTRQRRDDDPEGYETADEGFSLDVALEEIEKQSLVSWHPHPSGNIYAVREESLQTEICVMPFMAQNFDTLPDGSRSGGLGYKAIHGIYIVSSVDSYHKHLLDRENAPNFKSRLQESKDSLDWYLQNSSRVNVLENIHGQKEKTARRALSLLGSAQTVQEREAGIERAAQLYNYVSERLSSAS